MKKFLFLTTAVFLLLVTSMALYTPVAKADSPAEFVVGITRRSNTGVETPVLNAIVTARTVRKNVSLQPNNSPKSIPLNPYPYIATGFFTVIFVTTPLNPYLATGFKTRKCHLNAILNRRVGTYM